MSTEYIASVSASWDRIETIVQSMPDDYSIIITADHGGHDRSHGSDVAEDMTIPLFLKGKAFSPDVQPQDVNIIDLAPTISNLLGVSAVDEWEGKSLI